MKNVSKKLTSVILLIVFLVILAGNSLGLSSTVVTLQPSVQSVPLNGEFTVTVNVANTQDTIGVTRIEATLNYDEQFLTTLTATNIEGLSGWTATYDPNTKKVVASTTQGTVKSSTPIFKITFKTKSVITNSQTTTPTVNTIQPGTSTVNTTSTSTSINTNTNTVATPQTPVTTTQPQTNTAVGTTTTTPVQTGTITTQTPSTTTPTTTTTTGTINTTPVAQSGDAKIELANIAVSNGGQTQQITTRSISVKVGNTTTSTTPSSTTTPTTSSSNRPTTAPTINPKAGIEDTPVILLISLGIVAGIAFIRYRNINK